MSRASWAAVEVDEQGNVTASISGVVPNYMPQTAQAGEHLARTMAVQSLDGATTLHGDCASVVNDANASFKRACNKKRMHAAAALVTKSAKTGRFIKADRWVKAHVADDLGEQQLKQKVEQMDPQQRRDVLGNRAADELAKAANRDFQANASDAALLEQDAKDRRKAQTSCQSYRQHATDVAF